MALVQYSDSDSDTDDSRVLSPPPRPVKRIRQQQHNASLPPLPSTFHDLYASSTRVSVKDDPSLHGGRKRVIPHVEGNWPTHIYLEWNPAKEEMAILQNVLCQCAASNKLEEDNKIRMHSLLYSDLGAQLPLHISLSRPVVLRTEQRSSFTETLQTALQSSHIPPFDVKLDNLHWVSNYEKTRWFLVLSTERPENDYLNHLLRISNRALALFGQPPLYETFSSVKTTSTTSGRVPVVKQRQNQPDDYYRNNMPDYSHCFHISLAWSLTEPPLEGKEQTANVDLQQLKELSVHFSHVKVKIGNNVSSMPLSTEISHERGFGGL